MTKADGFTLFELLVSIAILGLIATATVMTLGAARPGEELRSASRIFTSDVENLTSRALAGANIATCETVGGTRVCDVANPSEELCIADCAQTPPRRVGLSIANVPTSEVALFADLDGNGRLTNVNEILSYSNMNPLGGEKVFVRSISTPHGDLLSMTLTMDRQSGRMRINPCGDAGFPACAEPEPDTATIVFAHQQDASKTSTITIDARTGRVSFSL